MRIAFLVVLAALAGCSGDASPEQQGRTVIDSMEVAAEARDVGDLMQHVSAAYRSADGLDRAETARYVRGYFVANQSIHLLTRIESLEFPAPDEARVKLQVGMAGRGVNEKIVFDFDDPMGNSTCVACGECVRRVETQLRRLARALTQVSTSVICIRSSGLYSTSGRRSAPRNACADSARAPSSLAESTV